ncbi:DEAD/DEAH box helicase [Paenibacillus ginsengarvi]|uniref:DEAD/DEAH box helicase n=1 Tax=Paenibacillus ginsengarvi TaxID=400777 RepID=A0A3B0CKA2_9BACL|nr:DEAD/DEAH box helicase [Paenibacillus ginsengarvi]RKN84757.1 DEAD/DEAH box helicase [Paenibacillus ginsengarvi]
MDNEAWQGGGPGPGCHPVLGAWFRDKFGNPTDIQTRTWEPIVSGRHVLLAAPTGSGKTLAALLPCLNGIAAARNTYTERGVRLIYVTPLKALNNDIHDHLLGFIKELEPYGRLYEEQTGNPWTSITAGVRTGDTTQSTRASMLRHPPDVLVTTPESLYILLASEKARQTLRTVEKVIVDEIHDLAEDKRGMHLSVTLERLESWCGRPLQRIGVSATINPMERVARYLGGWTEATGHDEASGGEEKDRMQARPVTIVQSAMDKTFDISVTMPEIRASKGKRSEIWTVIAARLTELMEGCRSVLVFVNNRRLCERVTLHLNEMAGHEMARSHHGSVSREKRLMTEKALKDGSLRCLVATSSLELGIDVGHVDLVIQIDSPQSAASGIQRIGRAGHSVGDVSRGIIMARHRGQLAECAVLAREITDRRIERICIPEGSIDVFCQQTAAMVASFEWKLDDLLALYRRSDSFHEVSRERLLEALNVLAGFYPHCRPLLTWDRDAGLLQGMRHTNAAVLTGAGTIPQSSAYPVYLADARVHIGELDEEYIHESRPGDVFQLGTASYRIVSIKGDRIYASEVEANAYSEIPFWRGDGPGRSHELSCKVGELLEELDERADTESESVTVTWLQRTYMLDEHAASSLVGLVDAQKAASSVPNRRRIVVEHYLDDVKRHHLVLHTIFGRRTNRTWMLALQRLYETRVAGKLYAYVRDNGIEFIFPEWSPEYADLWRSVQEYNLEELLAEALPSSPLFGITFRHLAGTSLLLARGFSRVPLWKQRMRSERLLEESLPYAGRFPFIREAMRISMYESLDPERVKELFRDIGEGRVLIDVRNVGYPSPFAAQFVWENVNTLMYESDAVSEDIQYRLLSVNKQLAGQFFEPAAFQQAMDAEEAQAWIDGRFSPAAVSGGTEKEAGETEDRGGEWLSRIPPAERLLRLLKRQGDLSFGEIRSRLGEGVSADEALAGLRGNRQVAEISMAGERRWICADEKDTYAAFPADEASSSFVLRRYADRQIAFTAEQLAERFGLSIELAERWIRHWIDDSTIERSPFAKSPEEPLWTSRSASSRLLRFSVGQMRKRAEPVEPDRYFQMLLALQYVLPESRLSGMDGLRQAIARLQGMYLPISHWESFVFPARVTDYKKDMLDLLCASGEAVWFGRKEEGEKDGRIAFYLTESKELLAAEGRVAGPSSEPELLDLLGRKGASFLTGLSRDTGYAPSELMERLMRLVWEGRVSNDQFAPIRLHGTGSGAKTSRKGFQSGLGRWYAVAATDAEPGAGMAAFGSAAAATEEISPEKMVVAWVHHLLQSFGIITRDVIAKHVPGETDRLQDTIRKLEDWGMLARGFWIRGLPYMQVAAPDTVERLRQLNVQAEGQTVVLSSVDPANPYGALLKWPERQKVAFARKPGNFLVFRRGRWVLWIENNGKRFVTIDPEWLKAERGEAEVVLEAVRVMLRQSGLRKIVVDSWNGAAVPGTEAAELFRRIGAESDRDAFVLWPSSLKG